MEIVKRSENQYLSKEDPIREHLDSYFDSSNILLYYKKLRNKLLNIKPKNLKDLYVRDYSSKLHDLELNLYLAKKLIEPGSYKDEKIHDFEQEIETFKKIYEEGCFFELIDYETKTKFTDEEKQKIKKI